MSARLYEGTGNFRMFEYGNLAFFDDDIEMSGLEEILERPGQYSQYHEFDYIVNTKEEDPYDPTVCEICAEVGYYEGLLLGVVVNDNLDLYSEDDIHWTIGTEYGPYDEAIMFTSEDAALKYLEALRDENIQKALKVLMKIHDMYGGEWLGHDATFSNGEAIYSKRDEPKGLKKKESVVESIFNQKLESKLQEDDEDMEESKLHEMYDDVEISDHKGITNYEPRADQSHPEVGDILHASFGYNTQLNSFYYVKRVTKSSVELFELDKTLTKHDGYGQAGYELPMATPRRNAEVMLKRWKPSSFGYSVKISNYEWAYPWDGKEKLYDSYD